MRLIKKLLLMALSAVMLFGTVGCFSNEDEGKTKLKISFFKAGFGDAWAHSIAKEFEKLHPDVKVIVDGSATMDDTIKNKFEANRPANVSDIVSVNRMDSYHDYIRKGYLEDLTDLYDSEVENGKKLDDVVIPSFKKFVTFGEEIYGVPWETAITGFAYNKKLFALNGWTVPATMDEFFVLCGKIKAKNIAPIVYSGGYAEGYFKNLYLSWVAQYEGAEGTEEFFGFGSPEVFKAEGSKKAYEQIAKIVADKNIVLNGSKGFDHLAAQREFIQGNAAMMPAGSWLETEMSEFLEGFPGFEMAMFPVPYINADGTDKNGEQADWVSLSNNNLLAVTKTSPNKELAKEFLLFMSRQDMLNTYAEKTGGTPRPFIYERTDWSNLSAFGQSLMNIWINGRTIFHYSSAPIFLTGDIGWWLAQASTPVTYMHNAPSVTNALTRAQEIFEEDYTLAVSRFQQFQAKG